MKRYQGLAALLLIGLVGTAEAEPEKTIEVTSLDQANSLTPDATSVSVNYTYQMYKADQFAGIMKTLARNPRIRHLKLRIPNSLHAEDQTLDVLREFQSLERLELFDDRSFQAASIFEQVAAMKSLKQVKLSFG